MTAVVISNTREAEDIPPDIPMRDGQVPFRFEMLYNGFTNRAYADTADELLAMLIRGYDRMGEGERLAARLHLAVRSQVTVQADINYSYDLRSCTPEEQVVLQGHRNTPPDITEWNAEVPLILIDLYYAPLGDLPRPLSAVADVNNPPNIFWLSPMNSYDFLISLHMIGLVALREHVEAAA